MRGGEEKGDRGSPFAGIFRGRRWRRNRRVCEKVPLLPLLFYVFSASYVHSRAKNSGTSRADRGRREGEKKRNEKEDGSSWFLFFLLLLPLSFPLLPQMTEEAILM